MLSFVSIFVVLCTLTAAVLIINRWDNKLFIGRGEWLSLGGICVVMGTMASQVQEAWIGLSVVLGCLLAACVTDRRYCMVHNFVWWIGGAAAVVMVLREGILSYGEKNFFEDLIFLTVFLFLQLFFFSKMYGKADCYAFCVCGLTLFGLNMHIYHCFMHMLVAYFILFILQFLRKNIAKTGNLKTPVAFLPYITASFLIILHKYAK